MSILEATPPRRDGWTATRWTLVSTLAHPEDERWEASWRYLVDTYRRPMEGYVRGVLRRIRGRTPRPEEVEDVVQGFLTTCVEKNWLARADGRKGSFRVYVRTLLRRFVSKHVRHQMAQKRRHAGGRATLELLEGDAVEEVTPDAHAENAEFDRSWVKVAVDRSLERLADAHVRYQVVIQDLLLTGGEGSSDLGPRVEANDRQLAVLKHRARRRFREVFEEELRATVSDPEAFEDEWRALEPYLP